MLIIVKGIRAILKICIGIIESSYEGRKAIIPKGIMLIEIIVIKQEINIEKKLSVKGGSEKEFLVYLYPDDE